MIIMVVILLVVLPSSSLGSLTSMTWNDDLLSFNIALNFLTSKSKTFIPDDDIILNDDVDDVGDDGVNDNDNDDGDINEVDNPNVFIPNDFDIVNNDIITNTNNKLCILYQSSTNNSNKNKNNKHY
jgi:hypothetical protein